MSIKISALPNLTPTANTIVFASDEQTNPNTSYKLSMSAIRAFASKFSYDMANSAYDKANASFLYANTSNSYANFVYNHSEAAFYAANVADSKVINTGYTLTFASNVANSAFIAANSAFDLSNTLNSQVSSINSSIDNTVVRLGKAYDHSNSAYQTSNISYSHAEAAFSLANSNYSNAFSANNLSNIALNNSQEAVQDSSEALNLAQLSFDRANSAINLSSNTVFTVGSLQEQANTISSDFYSYVISTDEINLKRIGVIGDGVEDDTASVQAVLDDCEAKTVYVPEGTYSCDSLVFSSNTTIVGSGPKSVFRCNKANINLFTVNAEENASDIKVSNISIVTNYSNCNAVYFSSNTEVGICSNIVISDVIINGIFYSGVNLANCNTATIQNSSISSNNDILFSNVYKSRIINNNLESSANNFVESNSNYNIGFGNILSSNTVLGGSNTIFTNNIEL